MQFSFLTNFEVPARPVFDQPLSFEPISPTVFDTAAETDVSLDFSNAVNVIDLGAAIDLPEPEETPAPVVPEFQSAPEPATEEPAMEIVAPVEPTEPVSGIADLLITPNPDKGIDINTAFTLDREVDVDVASIFAGVDPTPAVDLSGLFSSPVGYADAGDGYASAGGSVWASNDSGSSSVSVSSYAFVGDDGQSFASVDVDASGDSFWF